MITRSSAYNNSQGHPVLNSWDSGGRTMMKRSRLKTEPWHTPTFIQKLPLKQFSICTLLLALVHVAWISWMFHRSTPSLLIAGYFWWKKRKQGCGKFFFPTFKFVIVRFRTWKPNPLGLGKYSLPKFCETSFRYFCSLFTGT